MVKRQLRDSIQKKITQRESDYDKETETRKWESSIKRKTKSLVEDSGPTDLGRVRTMGKSDLAVSLANGSRPRIFTNTAVPKFDGTRCWEQYLLVFQAIVKSNGWSSDTAALQLVAHLDGEALQVALLVLSRNREGWREIEDELSAYYNTPGRLAVFRRRFENAHRRPGADPATFVTELGILALREFSDITEKGRYLMVRDKFIASQRSCDLRRHLDGAAPETSIQNIADSCRVWESHREPADIEDRSQNLGCRQQILPISGRTISKTKSGVGSMGPATICLPRRADHNMADSELRTVLEAVRECRETDMNDERDGGQCCSCGFLGHGEVHIPTRGKGWFGREGQPPGPSVTITHLTQVGVVVRLGNDRKKTLMDPDGPRMCRASQFWGALLRRKRTAAIVQYRSVQRWWIKMQNWTLSVVQRGVEPSGSFGALDKSTQTANAAGRERRVDTTDDVDQKKQRRNEIRRMAYIGGGGGFLSGAGTRRNEEAGRKT